VEGSSTDSELRVIRSTDARRWGVVQFVGMAVLAVAFGLFGGWIVLDLVAVVFIALAVRAAMLEVRYTSEGLTARNLLRSVHVARSEIERFEIQRSAGSWWWLRMPGSRVVCIRTGRRALPLLGTQSVHGARHDFYGQPSPQPPTIKWLEELQAALHR
jgi:hypothetical protein